jgi:oligoendopeptidase F
MNTTTTANRLFLPADLQVSDWEQLKPYFDELLSRDISSRESLLHWLRDRSELEAFLQEDMGWRYIRMSCDTADESYAEAFRFFVGEIQPQIAPMGHQLDLKLLASPMLKELTGRAYEILLRQISKRVDIFREENVSLISELQQKEQEYSVITGAMTVMVDGKELTLQQAAGLLEQDDAVKREQIYRLISGRRLQDRDRLDTLMNDLVGRRTSIALNAGFSDYRDYMFASLGRFDYTPVDCFRFHQSVERYIVPLTEAIDESQRSDLGSDSLKPWDLSAVKSGQQPLRPFQSAGELMQRTIACFTEIDPFLGDCMRQMEDAGRLDLESRKGKAPGGYNYPLYETGLPFIFMNSSNTLRDLVTMVHEGGHAVQSIVDRPLELVDFKNLPSEVAELASMSMELISMEHWHHFFSDPADLKRAKRKHLEDVLKGLPWIAAVDAFQHWIYTSPGHSALDRNKSWLDVHHRFGGQVVDWTGLEDVRSALWQKQLHIYEVPFYYIEYGFAQLGAVSLWRQYRQDPKACIARYLEALRMGYTGSIGEIYERAGVRFDFSDENVAELAAFLRQEWESLQ